MPPSGLKSIKRVTSDFVSSLPFPSSENSWRRCQTRWWSRSCRRTGRWCPPPACCLGSSSSSRSFSVRPAEAKLKVKNICKYEMVRTLYSQSIRYQGATGCPTILVIRAIIYMNRTVITHHRGRTNNLSILSSSLKMPWELYSKRKDDI